MLNKTVSDSGEGDGESEEAEEEVEEEEEEEPEDIKEHLEQECMKTAQCAPLKHHYDECAARVIQQEEEHGKAHEDCVEECEPSPQHREVVRRCSTTDSLTPRSLPHDALRDTVRRAEAVQISSINLLEMSRPSAAPGRLREALLEFIMIPQNCWNLEAGAGTIHLPIVSPV